MAKPKASASTKRTREDRVYQDKGKVHALLGFDTAVEFDKWRESPLVKPWWETFVEKSLDQGPNKGRKGGDEDNLLHRIREGERLGKRRYLSAMGAPAYDDAEDYHAWLVFWLAEVNTSDRNGCFWNKRLEKHQTWSAMHKFVLWAKRQRHRDVLAAPKKSKKAKAAAKETEPEEETSPFNSEGESESEDLDPEKGIAVVKWLKGMPDELELTDNADRVIIERLCSHTLLTFWKAVDDAFDLPKYMQRRIHLGPKDGSTFRQVQLSANKDPGSKRTIFYLETEVAAIPEETQSVPEPTIPTQEGDSLREAAYRKMVDEAAGAEANRFDMSVQLWRYNLMLNVANDGARVDLREVTLNLQGQPHDDGEDNGPEIEAIQYTHDTRSLNTAISGTDRTAHDGDGDGDGDGLSLPKTEIKDITAEEIARYHERNKWIDNPAYQPQNHTQACKNLGIPNPERPRIDGLLPSLSLDKHQPTAINALVEFEDSCVGAGLNAEEVGLGKTVETIGLLLFRSNQRKAAIEQGAQVSKALPTLIVLPQNLVEQWRDEIFEFTDWFTIYMYYGPPRKSVDKKVLYVPKNQANGRLTRSHKLFSGAEENSDVIILTSYATWTARHGPRVQWDWLCIQRQNQPTDSGKPSKKQAEKLLMNEGIAYHTINTGCPHQLFGLFERIILDEGHTIRHQSEDIGWAVSNTGSKYRHILSGTPTFDNIEEFAGIMRFLQNPQLSEKKYLLDMGFTEKELTTGTYENRKVSFLESATFWNDPYLLDNSHPRAQLKYTAEAMEKYLFNKAYNQGKGFDTVEQGRRLSQVLKKIMVRRTHSSLLNGVPIGKSLPSVQRMVFECAFTDLEREHYDFMMQDEATTLFKIKKSKNEKSVAWSTTAYRKWCLLASWLGFQYLLDYKASKLNSKRKNMSAFSILQDVQKGQDRLKIPKDKQIPLSKDADTENVQKILEQHCTGSPKLRQLLRILAEVVVLREEKALLWVNNPAQAEWLEHVLKLCGITTAQLRTDLRAGDLNKILGDFNSSDGKIQVLICSYMVSCAGLNMQKYCRTSIEYEPPPNEPVRKQELGRVRRRGQQSTWVRHITLLTKDTLNTKQDSEAILKNLPNLLTQLNMDVWGNGEDEEKTYALGEFVLYEGKLVPADDPSVIDLGLEPLGADDLLMQIQMQLSGRTSTTTADALRKQVKDGVISKKAKAQVKAATAGKNHKKQIAGDKATSSKEAPDAAAERVVAEAAAEIGSASVKVEPPNKALWT